MSPTSNIYLVWKNCSYKWLPVSRRPCIRKQASQAQYDGQNWALDMETWAMLEQQKKSVSPAAVFIHRNRKEEKRNSRRFFLWLWTRVFKMSSQTETNVPSETARQTLCFIISAKSYSFCPFSVSVNFDKGLEISLQIERTTINHQTCLMQLLPN